MNGLSSIFAPISSSMAKPSLVADRGLLKEVHDVQLRIGRHQAIPVVGGAAGRQNDLVRRDGERAALVGDRHARRRAVLHEDVLRTGVQQHRHAQLVQNPGEAGRQVGALAEVRAHIIAAVALVCSRPKVLVRQSIARPVCGSSFSMKA